MSETTQPKPATDATVEQNRGASAAMISFDDSGDSTRAHHGRIARHDSGVIGTGPRPVWDRSRHDFVRDNPDAPDSVHPSLWRQARLNSIDGLFQVMDGVWQVRGYDLSNITFIAGETGWLVIDPLTATETAAVALDLVNAHIGERPVLGVIYTHSHVDHYGGVLGVTTREAVANGEVTIIAPDGFMEEVVGENLIGGPIMSRRSIYQFGMFLPAGERGQVDAGLGTAVPAGEVALIAPTDTITTTGEERVIDGIRVVFQMTPDAEAPAEMNFYFPDLQMLCSAENCTHTLHNLYPIRGAQPRNALAWSKYIQEAMLLWGDDAQTLIASHHWPRFGNDDVRGFLTLQRDVYRWLHDQTMRLANHGHTPNDIGELMKLPACFDQSHVRGYYGTVSHNSRSVYAKYLGWYDGNPANLNPLNPQDAGRRFVDYMGGADAVIARAQADFDGGEYRWVAQVLNHVIFADPTNNAARELQADALEQLGYQAESATWRNAYLMGAQELRNGAPRFPLQTGRNQIEALSAENLFDVLGVRFNPAKSDRDTMKLQWHFTDLGEDHLLGVANQAIHHIPNATAADADASIRLARSAVFDLYEHPENFDDRRADATIEADGDLDALRTFFGALDYFSAGPLAEPDPDRPR